MKNFFLTTILSIALIHLMYASDGPNIWSTSLSSAGQIWSMSISSSSQNTIYAGSNTTGVWKSTNLGLNWTQTVSGLTNLSVQTLAASNSNPNVLYCGTSQTGAGAGIYKSTNAGATWTQINSGIVETSLGIQSIAINPVNPDIAYVSVFDGLIDSQQGLYKTTNGGTTWSPANTGIGTIKNILPIVINQSNPNVLYCGTSFSISTMMGPSKIYKSVDAAASWTDISTGLPGLPADNKPVRCISISRSDTSMVLAGLFLNTDSLSGMYVTSNGGGIWERRHTGLPNAVGTLTRSCVINPLNPNEFFVGIGNATNTGIGVFRSTNKGLTWTDFNGGTLSNTTTIRSLFYNTLSLNTLYAGGAHPTLSTGQGVFEYTFSGVGIGEPNGNMPDEFSLMQNYPNPFNPVTKIKYELTQFVSVELKVYDMNGKEVKTLVNEKQNPRIHEVNFDGSGLASGTYYYKLSAGSFSETKKMILLK